VFPVSLDIDHPTFRAGLERLRILAQGIDAAKRRGGIVGGLKRLALMAAAAATFARLYLLPVQSHALPEQVSMVPAW